MIALILNDCFSDIEIEIFGCSGIVDSDFESLNIVTHMHESIDMVKVIRALGTMVAMEALK